MTSREARIRRQKSKATSQSKGPRRQRRPPQTHLELDAAIDELIAKYGTHNQLPAGASLYHYTNRTGFRGIVSTRRFWAVAHSSAVKDSSEGRHAESTISPLLAKLVEDGGFAAVVIRRATEMRSKASFTQTGTYRVGISCFSTTSNGERHWREHARAGDGPGFCLRIPVLYEPWEIPHVGMSLVRVIYDPSAMEARLRNAVCQVLRMAAPRREVELAASGVARLCDVSAVLMKSPDYAWEAEYRRVALSEMGHDEVWSAGERPRMELAVRRDGLPLEIEEVHVDGSDFDIADTEGFLREHGYGANGVQMPGVKRRTK